MGGDILDDPPFEEGDYSEYAVYIDRTHEDAFREAMKQFEGHVELSWKDWHSA